MAGAAVVEVFMHLIHPAHDFNFMATLAKGGRIIKNLSPEDVGRLLAEALLANGDIDYDGRVKVKTEYNFRHGEKMFCGARVEVVAL